MEESDQAPAHARSSSSGEPPFVNCRIPYPETVNIGCGWGRFRPAILAPLAHVWTFIVLYIVFSFTHGVHGAYGVAVLTTIEKRFNFSSKLAGIVINFSIFGYLISIVFVSFFLTKTNKPRLFAVCMLVTSTGAFLYMLPHIVYGTGNDSIDPTHAQRQTFFNNTALMESGSGAVQLCAYSNALGGPAEAESSCSATEKQTADESASVLMPVVVMFVIAELLHGIAGAPILTLGLAFIDDHTDPELSAKLIGLMYTVRFMSPIASYAMGGYLLTIYASLKETDLTPKHPQWIGAWWLGFLVTTVINFVICIPTSMLSKNLRPIRKSSSSVAASPKKGKKIVEEEEEKDDEKEKEKGEEEEKKENGEKELQKKLKEEVEGKEEREKEEVSEDKEQIEMEQMKAIGQESSSGPNKSTDASSADWKEFPKAVMRLTTNPIYMLSLTTTCIDWYALGFLAFLPKYFEVHFQKTASVANILGGMIPQILAAVASYVGGIVSGKIKGIDGGVAGLCAMNFTLSVITLLLVVPAMVLSCPDVPYSGHLVKNRLNLTTECNVNCGCSSDKFDPVCGSDGFLYFSPCHAGCTQLTNSTAADPNELAGRLVRSAECECVSEVEGGDEDGREGVVFAGFCDNSCASLIPYVLTLIAIFVVNNLSNASDTGVILRSIRKEDKSFALGLNIFCIAIFVFPAPLVYGFVFDSSCILKKTTSCTNSEGNCLLYDRHALRLGFHGVAIGIKSVSTIVHFSTYLVARRKRYLLTRLNKKMDQIQCA